MANAHRPRRGSLGVWPRKRARKETPSAHTWIERNSQFLGFAGYKAGMTHIQVRDMHPKYGKKGEIVNHPVTIIECPPLKPLAIRFYIVDEEHGLRVNGHLFSSKTAKDILKRTTLPKKTENVPQQWDQVRLLVYTQPQLTTIGKKIPDIFEMHIKQSKKIDDLKKLLEKNIPLTDVFNTGEFLDAHGVTKGKGFQGTVKRFGVTIRQHKSEKTKRGIGTLGSWTPKHVSYTTAQAGRMGYHQRVDYNKQIMLISSKAEDINPKGGLVHYGVVKNTYMLIKGSLPGPKHRLILFTNAQRAKFLKPVAPEITYVSKESQQ